MLVVSTFSRAGDFVDIAEGLTSSSAKAGITVAYRMFSLPDMPSVCEAAHANQVVSLRAVSARVKLQARHGYPLSNLKVVAVDASGSILPRVPIQIQVEQVSPAIIDTRSDRLQGSVVMPARPGHFRFRVKTACGSSDAQTVVVADVVL